MQNDREKGRDRFWHTCAGPQLLRIGFAGDTAAPAGRVNIDAYTFHRFVCTSGPKRQQFVQRQYDGRYIIYVYNLYIRLYIILGIIVIIYCIPTVHIIISNRFSFSIIIIRCNR